MPVATPDWCRYKIGAMSIDVINADCMDALKDIPDCSVDSCVTDPPYHLTSIVKRFGGNNAAPAQFGTDGAYARASRGFMGKQWDGGDIAFRSAIWEQVLRVLKPGAHLLSFGGTRTYHRMVCAIEDAGFEIRDTILWLYGSGFPKSHDVSKAIDRAAGEEREIIADGPFASRKPNGSAGVNSVGLCPNPGAKITAPASSDAIKWQGWGTALKPACEPIVMARKPLEESTVAAQVLETGTGALNVDACRIHASDAPGRSYVVKRLKTGATLNATGGNWRPDDGPQYQGEMKPGRWPANVCHDGSDDVLSEFSRFGDARAGGSAIGIEPSRRPCTNVLGERGRVPWQSHSDSGSASRFFYTAKADKSDRLSSKHPTVKPVDLMRWLVRMVTPPGGTVLDPFSGSGTTGMACLAEGFNAILIEKEKEYYEDILNRIKHVRGDDTPLFRDNKPAQGTLL